MYENEFEALTLKLERALENVQGLVRDNDALTLERSSLRVELIAAKAEAAEANSRASNIEILSNWELMAKNRHISELNANILALQGKSVFQKSPDPTPLD